MIQPVTLRLESIRGQKNTSCFNRRSLRLVLMVQLHLLMSKRVIKVLEVHELSLFSQH